MTETTTATTTPTPRRSNMWMQQLLSQLITQNEILKLSFEDKIQSLQQDLVWMKAELNDAITRGLQRPDVSDMMVEPTILEPNPEENGWTEA